MKITIAYTGSEEREAMLVRRFVNRLVPSATVHKIEYHDFAV